jgi:hypothetical protein
MANPVKPCRAQPHSLSPKQWQKGPSDHGMPSAAGPWAHMKCPRLPDAAVERRAASLSNAHTYADAHSGQLLEENGVHNVDCGYMPQRRRVQGAYASDGQHGTSLC